MMYAVPALPSPGDVIRVQLKHTGGPDTDILSRLYFLYSGAAPSASGLTAMCGSVATAWGSDIKSLVPAAISLTEVLAEDLSSSSGASGSDAVSIAGTRSGLANPLGSAVLLNFAISRRYRGGRPRVYLPYGTADDLATTFEWTSAFQTAMLSGWASFVTAVIAAAPSGTTITQQVNVGYYHGFASVQNPVTKRWRNINTPLTVPNVDQVTNTTMQAHVASQRRRNGNKR